MNPSGSDGAETTVPHEFSRRGLLAVLGGLGLTSSVFARALLAQAEGDNKITSEMIRQAEWIAELELTDEQRSRLADNLEKNRRELKAIRAIPCDADVPPASVFRPDFFAEADPVLRLAAQRRAVPVQNVVDRRPHRPTAKLPSARAEIAFSSLSDQADWLQSKELSSVELTELYLDRIAKYDPALHLLVTNLGERALEQARQSDRRRALGASLGVLDGVPWVAKDLISVPPYKTTWGAAPYRDQVRPAMATVAQRLESAGAVLLAKVSLGALAWGDIWFGGKTRNPWNTEQGSSGSSAGSCSAVVAGLATYAIGSETLGSIVSPCIRCSVSGLRPSFGRVSRFGCMPLAWSFDKIGPIARHVDDLATVFSHILGPDGRDPSVVDRDYAWPDPKPLNKLVVGTAGQSLSDVDQQALQWLKDQGARHVEVKLPSRLPQDALTVMLNVEATAVFDDLLRSDPTADMGLWPESFRKGQFISAVQYLRASRLRTQLIQETESTLREVDILLGADDLVLTNLTGHPSLVVALDRRETSDTANRPGTVKLTAALYRESLLLTVASQLQQAFPPATLAAQYG